MQAPRTIAFQLLTAGLIGLLAAAVTACAGSASPSPTGGASATAGAAVVIQSPPSNVQVPLGQPIEIVTTAVSGGGVGWIDVEIGGAVVSRATAPSPLPSFGAVHVWTPTVTGSISVAAIAYGADAVAGDPFAITVFVLPADASLAPYPTFDGPLPTYVVTALASGALPAATYAPASYGPRATATNGTAPTYAVAPTTAVHPTNPPPTPTYPPVDPTDVAPTPTYGAAPTVAPTSLIAPVDGIYSWVIPYNGSSEISEYVSYPDGDVEDRINYDISGMSASPPGNTGHLNVFATCEGVGAGTIQVKVGTRVFPCNGQVIFALLVTDDSRTGTIRVTATGPAYVHWTLNGNVAP